MLLKSAAAYYQTALAAAAAMRRTGGSKMTKKEKVKDVAAGGDQGQLLVSALGKSLGPVIANALTEGLKPFVSLVKTQQGQIARIAASVEELKVINIEAAKDAEVEDEEVEEIDAEGDKEEAEIDAEGDKEVAADSDDDDEEEHGKKKHDDGDEDDDDDAELDAEMEHLEGDPGAEDIGKINHDAKNEGDKTTRTGGTGKAKHMAIKGGSIAASSLVRELYASHRALRKKYKTLRASSVKRSESLENKIEALEAQVEQYAEKVDRKSMPAELGNFLAKAGYDVRELYAEGKKLPVTEVDNMFANSPVQLDPVTRIWFKNQLQERGLMEDGEVHR